MVMIKKLKSINIYSIALLILIPIICLFKFGWTMDADIWFILNVGKYIYGNGFPHVDIFSMHEGLNYVVQQWAYALLVWPLFKWIGPLGIFIINVLCSIILIVLIYKLCSYISNNKKISLLISILILFLMVNGLFITLRPQMFSYIFLISLLLTWEKYMETGNNKYLILLPILSILQSNFHASLWWLLIIYSLPFIAEIFIINVILKKKTKANLQVSILVLTIMFFCGAINPYGIEAINYLFKSINPYASKYINEMILFSSTNKYGISIISILFIYVLYLCYVKKRDIKLRYLFLVMGSFIIAFTASKCVAFFYLCAVYPLAYLFKDWFNDKNNIKFIDRSILFKCIYILIIIISFILCFNYRNRFIFKTTYKNENVFSELKEKIGTDNVTLYTNYAYGSYAEYIGFKCFIDTRAELYYATLNGKDDIFDDNYLLQRGGLSIDEFLDKYKMTHLLVFDEDTMYLYKDIDNYHLLFEGDTYRVYERDDYNES